MSYMYTHSHVIFNLPLVTIVFGQDTIVYMLLYILIYRSFAHTISSNNLELDNLI